MNDEASGARIDGLRVLVIEDQWLVTEILEDILTSAGCEVVGLASRFPDAEKKARSLACDIVVLDVNLGGTMTYPIAEILAGRKIPFIFATGYGAAAVPAHLQAVPVLQKPFERRGLEWALRAALEARDFKATDLE